jgi:hypothetical protein
LQQITFKLPIVHVPTGKIPAALGCE